MKNRTKRVAVLATVFVIAAGALAACSPGASGKSGQAVKIGLLLPESKTTRYEHADKPMFEEKLRSLGDYDLVYANASQDAAKQQQQAESALAQGIKVLVIDPVDAVAAKSIVSSAAAQKVAVIAYDRFIESKDLAYYVAYDAEKVGELQGHALVDRMRATGASGGILMINGSPTDSNAANYKRGAHTVIDASGIAIVGEYDTPDWSPEKAQDWTTGQISLHAGAIGGVYAANDGTAGGAIAAFLAAGVNPVPPVTGQDSEISALQRLLSSTQFMTVYKAIQDEATSAAEAAVALATGKEVSAPQIIKGTPSKILDPVVVTAETIKSTVLKDEFVSIDEFCTREYAAACARFGLT